MLVEFFPWLQSDSLDIFFAQEMVSKSDFQREKDQALIRRRALVADQYETRRSKTADAPSLLSEIAKHLDQVNSYICFLSDSITRMDGAEPMAMPLFAIKWLLSKKVESLSSEEYVKKLKALFYCMLRNDPQKTLEIYCQYQCEQPSSLKTNPEEYIKLVQHWLETLTIDFGAQENPLSLIDLLREFVEEPLKFAAAILWLLQRKISVAQILETGLLQDFMSYHLVSLNNPDDPCLQLYVLLGQFPKAQPLIDEANKVQCQDRGFHCEEGGTHSFSITGLWCQQKDLYAVNVKPTLVSFTPTLENFSALYQCFELNFIKLALVWHAETKNDQWGIALRQWINQEEIKLDVLSKVINFIAVDCKPGTLDILAPLFEDTVLEKLLSKHYGAILHFLPYNRAIRQKITTTDTAFYLKKIMESNTTVLDVIPQLVAMLTALRQENNNAAATLVYERLVDLILENPEYLDDRLLLKQLKSFPEKELIFAHVCQKLKDQFDQTVQEGLQNVVITEECYHTVEDTWRDVSLKLSNLHELSPVTVSFPSDKYKMQAHLAKSFFSSKPSFFCLDQFFQSLEIVPVLSPDAVNHYERLLIEILTFIDDETIRNQIISVLETRNKAISMEDGRIKERLHWTQVEYGEACVLELAAFQGNLGLVQWLITTKTVELNDITHAATRAAQANQWAIVDYLCSTDKVKLDQETLKELLMLAAGMGHLDMVRRFCERLIVPLESRSIIQAFAQAADNCHLQVIEYFCNLSPHVLSDGMLAKTIRMAVQRERLGMIAFLGNLPKSRKLSDTVEVALVQEVVHDRLSLVQQLCHLQTNTPSQSAIEAAFAKAIKYDHFQIAEFFCGLPQDIAPSQKAFDALFDECIANGSYSKVEFLCGLKTHHPSPSAIERALLLEEKSSPLRALGLFNTGRAAPPPTSPISHQIAPLAASL